MANVFRSDKVSRELDEELAAHVAEAVARGRDPVEARRALGGALQWREASRDVRMAAWLDSLRSDAVYGWRQLYKRKATSAAAVLSLGLAIGACTGTFRLIDALLLRPLPVTHPDQLYEVAFTGKTSDGQAKSYDTCSYPLFQQMRAAVRGQAELIAVSQVERIDVAYGAGETEKAYRQSVSGWMFPVFGLRPALGRLFTESDDSTPGAHPQAVISYDYWTRRFGRDRSAVGRTMRIGERIYEIVGVAPEPFTGTEPGSVTDIFLPAMMRGPSVRNANAFWLRVLVRPREGIAPAALEAKLYAAWWAHEHERSKSFVNYSGVNMASYPQDRLALEPAAAGVSVMQREYQRSLAVLAVLVSLVLLIACANVANLMTAQAASRAREMALRVSIGAGRGRLAQLMLLESAWLAALSSAAGALFAWRAAPLVVARIRPADTPARLVLPADWRVLGFALALTAVVTLLLGLAPALRAARTKPATALKGGEDPRSRRRSMHLLIAAQVAFCVLVLFVAGLFAATFERLSRRPTGFSAERLLALDVVAEGEQPAAGWEQVADYVRGVPGVDKAALADWALLSGTMSNRYVSVQGAAPGNVLCFLLAVSPGWLETMRIPLLDGRDFRPGDVQPGTAIVNQTFARKYFGGSDPVGKRFETVGGAGERAGFEIVGLAADAQYRNLREAVLPVAYLPLRAMDAHGMAQSRRAATLMVRTAAEDPQALLSSLLREVVRARPGFRVSTARTQDALVKAQTIRERLLAMLALFFGGAALLLAGIGLYGVLDHAVLVRRREIGIRISLGAGPGRIAGSVTGEVLRMVLAGAAAGIGLGLALSRFLTSLLFDVKPGEAAVLALPLAMILAAALLAAIPAALRAIRTDPAAMLRAE